LKKIWNIFSLKGVNSNSPLAALLDPHLHLHRLCELVPSYLFTSLRHSCTSLSSLTFHRCALGPHTSLAALPTSLATLTFRSCVFVKKSSLFDSIWRQLPRLVELRIEDMVSFSRLDCHAVLTDLGIDFDIKFAANAASPSFIFYRKL